MQLPETEPEYWTSRRLAHLHRLRSRAVVGWSRGCQCRLDERIGLSRVEPLQPRRMILPGYQRVASVPKWIKP